MTHMTQDAAEEIASNLLTIVSELRIDAVAALENDVIREASQILFSDDDDYSSLPTIFIALTRRDDDDHMEVIEPPFDGKEWEDFSKDKMVAIVRSIVAHLRPDWVLHVFECFSVAGDQKTAIAATSWLNMGQPLRLFPGAIEQLRAHLTGGESGDTNICFSRDIHKDGTLGEVTRIQADASVGRYAETTDPMRDPYPGALDE